MGQESVLAQQPEEAQQAAEAPQTESVDQVVQAEEAQPVEETLPTESVDEQVTEQVEEAQPAEQAPADEPVAEQVEEAQPAEQAPVAEPVAEQVEEVQPAEQAPAAEQVEEAQPAEPVVEEAEPVVEPVEEALPVEQVEQAPEPPAETDETLSESVQEEDKEDVEDLQAMLMAEGVGEPPGSDNPMAALLHENDYGFRALHRGQIVEGVIVQVRPNELLVDVGSKSEGVVMQRELDRLGAERLAEMNEGDSLLVYVVSPEDKSGNVILSLSRAQMEHDWRHAQELFEASDIFGGKVAGFNKGGLIVRVGKVRGFVPASQVVSTPDRRKNGSGQDFLSALVGQDVQCKIIEIDRSRNRLILSERAAQRELRKQHKEKLLQELQVDEVREGQVISLCDFGAFVDLGGADGLVHLSELSWRRVSHPSEVLKVGDDVRVKVLNVDRERRRIGLSLKRLESDPWSSVSDRYHVDQLVEGTVTKLVKFGAFARIFDDDIEGLIHLSELSDERITHPREVVQEGDVRTLRVIRIDPDRRRIGLSLKRVASDDYLDVDWGDEYERPLPGEDMEEDQDAPEDLEQVEQEPDLEQDAQEPEQVEQEPDLEQDAQEPEQDA